MIDETSVGRDQGDVLPGFRLRGERIPSGRLAAAAVDGQENNDEENKEGDEAGADDEKRGREHGGDLSLGKVAVAGQIDEKLLASDQTLGLPEIHHDHGDVDRR